MAQFQVPQFIEIEDKIFGPFTFKQFVYLVGGTGISFVLWVFLPKFIAVLLIPLAVGFSLALAFYKINSKPFINVLESAFKYGLSNKLYLWKKEGPKPKKQKREAVKEVDMYVPKLSDSKLKELSWSLDVHKKVQ